MGVLSTIVPKTFLGFIPLHIGAEIIVGVGIFNKISGIYGILSLFTGHPINAAQWLLNITSLIALFFFIIAYRSIKKSEAVKFIIFSYFYVFDVVISSIFTIYFSFYWFDNEGSDSSTERPDLSNLSAELRRQSATPSQEKAFTITSTVLFLIARFYFALVVLGYARFLVRVRRLKPLPDGVLKGTDGSLHKLEGEFGILEKIQTYLRYYCLQFNQEFWYGKRLAREMR